MAKVDRLSKDNSSLMTVCPHLGLEEDEHTCAAYPSEWNVCYRAKPVATVSLGHQQRSCLTSEYRSCPMVQSEKKKKLPVRLRGRRKVAVQKTSRLIFSVIKRN